VEAVGHDRPLRHRPLEVEDPERAGRAEDCQPVRPLVPEFFVVGQRLELLQQRANLPRGVRFLEGGFHLPQQVPIADRILLVFRVRPMRREVE